MSAVLLFVTNCFLVLPTIFLLMCRCSEYENELCRIRQQAASAAEERNDFEVQLQRAIKIADIKEHTFSLQLGSFLLYSVDIL